LPISDPVKSKSGLKTAIRWSICLVVVVCVGYALRRNVQGSDWRHVRFRGWLVLAAALCVAATATVQLVIFRMLLGVYHGPLPWRAMMAVSWIPSLGKYLPGKLGALAGTVYLLRRERVPVTVALSVALIQDGMAVITGLMVAAPLLGWRPVRERLPGAWLWCSGVMLIGLILLHPAIFTRIANAVLKRLGRQPLRTEVPLRDYAAPLIATFGQWVFIGLGLWCITRSVSGPSLHLYRSLFFMAVAALGMTVGYLTLIPGGLGIRDGLFLLALTPVLGDRAALVAVAMRILQTLVEITLTGVGALALWSSPPGPAAASLEAADA
jgi:uncharacterized membrane protein YbhN (UPF0104 family)